MRHVKVIALLLACFAGGFTLGNSHRHRLAAHDDVTREFKVNYPSPNPQFPHQRVMHTLTVHRVEYADDESLDISTAPEDATIWYISEGGRKYTTTIVK